MGSQQYCLRWNNHQSNMLTVFGNLFSSETLVDVTLACEGAKIHAHKVVLSACSPFFQEIFMSNPCKHPVVILKDMKFSELKAILEFMYKGEVNVSQENLPALLKSAENLKVKGLAEVTSEQQKSKDFSNNCTLQPPDVENSATPAGISSHVSPPVDEVIHKKKKKRPKSGQHCDMSVNKICKSEELDTSREDLNLANSPNPHESYEQIESTLPQPSITSNMQNTHHHSPRCKEEEDDRILETHEIKRSISPTNNPEYVLDPTNFMEQSLTTDQAFVSNQASKEPLSPSNSSSMIITAGNDNSLDCNQSDSSVYVEDTAVQGPSHSSLSPGASMQYDSNANNNNNPGSLMMYVEPRTSSSGPSGSSGITSNRPGSPNKTTDTSLECHVCKRSFCNANYMRKHFEAIHADQSMREKFSCLHCPRSYLWKHKLRDHVISAHYGKTLAAARIQCCLCQMLFTKKSLLMTHIQKVHSEELSLETAEKYPPYSTN